MWRRSWPKYAAGPRLLQLRIGLALPAAAFYSLPNMKICTYNILEGGVGRIDPIAEVIRLAGADVVVVEEAWDEALFHKLADRLGMDRFLADNPAVIRKGATGLLTRWEIREAVNHAPLDKRLTRSAFHAILPHGETELALIGLHLHARETWADEQIRLTELPAIFDIADQIGRPHLLLGDFNTSHPQQMIDITKLRPKSRERIAGQGNQLPREVIGRVLEKGYIDTHAIFHTPEQFATSMTTSRPAMRVDFIFATPELAARTTSNEVFKPELAKFASDHFPVVAELAIG